MRERRQISPRDKEYPQCVGIPNIPHVEVTVRRPALRRESHGRAMRVQATMRAGGKRCQLVPPLEEMGSVVETSAGGRDGETGPEHSMQACMLLDRWPESRRPMDIVHRRITRLH